MLNNVFDDCSRMFVNHVTATGTLYSSSANLIYVVTIISIFLICILDILEGVWNVDGQVFIIQSQIISKTCKPGRLMLFT